MAAADPAGDDTVIAKPSAAGPSKCRLSVYLARDAPRAAILRRGPSKQVGLFLWHLDRDVVDEGQWLRGRIYEHRCDLSPNGEHFVYFAAKWGRPMETWTAVSRPPWLTAVALWEMGGTYGGGGMFDSDHSLMIQHMSGLEPTVGSLPRTVRVRSPDLQAPVRGWDARLVRDGWTCVERGGKSPPDFGAPLTWRIDPPTEWTKPCPRRSNRVLSTRIHGVHERKGDGDWLVIDHVVRSPRATLELGRTEWADWASNGDLLFAERGVLHRLRYADGLERARAKVIVDLRERTFVARASPIAMRSW